MKWYAIMMCVLFVCLGAGTCFEQYLKSQEKQKQLEIEKSKLELKLKEK